MAFCPICKKEQIGFEWTKTKNNKNWLRKPNGEWHSCGTKKPKGYVKLTKDDFDKCLLCDRFILSEETHKKHPQIYYISMEDHLRLWHPNGEELDDVDFMVLTDDEKAKMKD